MNSFSLTIVVPCKNEENNVLNVLHKIILFKKDINVQVIVVDDGSSDSTFEKVNQFKKDNGFIELIRNEKSLGLGGAFWSALKHASGEFVFILPGDDENDVECMFDLFNGITFQDLVVCHISNLENRSFFRRSLSSLFTLILNFTFRQKLKYYNGTSIYRKATLMKIKPECSGFFFSAEIVLKFIKFGYKYSEASVKLNKIRASKSNALTLESFYRVVLDYFKLVKFWYF